MRKIIFGIFLGALLAVPLFASGYTIQKGDTLWKIAQKFDSSVEDLVWLNNIQNPDLIYEGDELFVELKLGATPAPTSSAYRKYVEAVDFQLFNGAAAADTSITLDDLEDIYGNNLTMSDFGSKGYARISPDGTSESISFTGITTNADGTVTLTGVSSVEAKFPYTETSGLRRSHSIGALVRITNTAAFYDTFANKENDEVISGGVWSWLASTTPYYRTHPTFTSSTSIVDKAYVDGVAIAGAPTATLSVLGYSQLATQAEMASSTWDSVNPAVLHSGYSTTTRVIAGNWIVITEDDGYINQSFLDLSEAFTWTALHTFSGGLTSSATTTLSGTNTFIQGTNLFVQVPSTTVQASTTNIGFGGGYEVNINATTTLDGRNLQPLIDGNTTSLHSHQEVLTFTFNSSTISNTSYTSVASTTIPANYLSIGDVIETKCWGSYTEGTGPNGQFRLSFNGTTMSLNVVTDSGGRWQAAGSILVDSANTQQMVLKGDNDSPAASGPQYATAAGDITTALVLDMLAKVPNGDSSIVVNACYATFSDY